jgi:hypothetical protein
LQRRWLGCASGALPCGESNTCVLCRLVVMCRQ